ncbi:IclR family transcriptional regulator [Ursidibacter sp. B-7004-1]
MTKQNTISCVAETLNLLNIIAKFPNKGLSELARLSELNKSRTFRILCTLTEYHFIYQTKDGSYQLGHQLLILGQAVHNQLSLIQAVENVSERLSLLFNENLQLRVIENNEVVQIWRKVSSQSLQVRSMVGNRRPLGAGAAGKLLLAFAEQSVRESFLVTCSEEQIQQWERDCSQIQQDGLSISKGELTQGVCAIAAPIFNTQGQCIASFSMSIPDVRAEDAKLVQIITEMKQAAEQISTLLGYKK